MAQTLLPGAGGLRAEGPAWDPEALLSAKAWLCSKASIPAAVACSACSLGFTCDSPPKGPVSVTPVLADGGPLGTLVGADGDPPETPGAADEGPPATPGVGDRDCSATPGVADGGLAWRVATLSVLLMLPARTCAVCCVE